MLDRCAGSVILDTSRAKENMMYIKEYTFYVNEEDKVVRMTSSHIDGDIACYGAMVNLEDKVTLIRVRDE